MKHCLLALFVFAALQSSAQQFSVSYPATAFEGPFSGNVLLYMSAKDQHPKNHNVWPCYRLQVKNIQPGQPVLFNDVALSYPTLLSRIARGDYFVQAVWDRDLGGRVIGESPGNMYSETQKFTLNDTTGIFALNCDQVIPEPQFVNSSFVKEIKVRSDLLSQFHGKDEYLRGAVILPAIYYSEPGRHFPLYITVGGYGGAYYHYSASVSSDTMPASLLDTINCIKLYLDGDCRLGHTTYANSDNNGPVGDAFVKEMLPALDRIYRTNGARLIRGHSSGGWTVAYLLTHYPKAFAGGNSSAPDPVDFHAFYKTDLYHDKARVEFVDWAKFSHNDDLPQLYDQPNITRTIETIIYRGEQNVSFDAVYSPKGKDGFPVPLYDPETGEINRQVFAHWKQYDITQYVIAHWRQLQKDLDGKLRFSVGMQDPSQQPAVTLMDTEMKKLGAKIEFAYYPGTHFTVGTPAYKRGEADFLVRCYLAWQKNQRNK